ncbi:MAG TPA: hypothetical protein GX497_02535 [Bacillus bacterium]|nr:hypothetical protein [Bacillus sp. (in: firmicutes)]
MLKYMKYEIKGTYKYIFGILALVLLLITGLYAYGSRGNEGSIGGNLFIFLSVMILFGTALVTFLFIVGSFRKELYEDRGYLTFTLPLTGNQIVASKLIVALLWFFILGFAIATYNILMVLSFIPVELNISELFSLVDQVNITEIAFFIITSVLSGVYLLVLIYFSMALGKATFRSKRIGGLWFVIFLVLNGVFAFGQFAVGGLFPYYLNIETFNVEMMDKMNSTSSFMYNNGIGIILSSNAGMLLVNIASSLFNIATTVALFFGTGYLIEKKIDL